MNEINPIKSMEIIRTQQTIARTLENIGNLYKDEFNEAILNFEDKFINDSHQALSMRRITDESTIEMQRLLTRKGFSLIRQGNNHEIWKHPNLKKVTSLPRHKKLSTFVIASIQKDIEDAIQ